MGAVTNMRPDLFRAVVADVPFVDLINTMRDPTLEFTTQEWQQWGNPNLPEQFAYMRSYSPYDNVERKPYPAILATAGLNDPRVNYWEPAKWVAKLRATKTDANPILLKVNMGAGHGGRSGRYEALHDDAFRYAFVMDMIGTPDPRAAAHPRRCSRPIAAPRATARLCLQRESGRSTVGLCGGQASLCRHSLRPRGPRPCSLPGSGRSLGGTLGPGRLLRGG